MKDAHFDFVETVAADRDLVVTSAHQHACRLEPRESELAWHCDLDDGTPTGESDPAAYVRWVCPALGVGTASTARLPPLEVRRRGPQSDLGMLIEQVGRLFRRPSPRAPGVDPDGPFVYTDPAGVLDDALRQRIEHWPSALHGDGVVRPAELSSVTRTREGLIVGSSSWWGSAPALDHQIGLSLHIARRLTAQR